MKTENRHINFQEPEGMMLLRYIKDTASNEEKSYIEAWLEADENNKRILLQTARIYYANNAMERIASRNPLIAYEKLEQRLAKRTCLYWLRITGRHLNLADSESNLIPKSQRPWGFL